MAKKNPDETQAEQSAEVMEATDGLAVQPPTLDGSDTAPPTVNEENPFADAAVADMTDQTMLAGTSKASEENTQQDASQQRLDEARERLGDNAPQRPQGAPDEGLNGTEEVVPLGAPNPNPSPSLAAQRGTVFISDPNNQEEVQAAQEAQVWPFEPPTNQDKPFGSRIDVSGDQQVLAVGPLDVHEYTNGGTNIEEQQKIRRTVADAGIENPVVTRPRFDSSPVVSQTDPNDPSNSVLR